MATYRNEHRVTEGPRWPRLITAVLTALFAALLAGCAQDPPACGDESTVKLVKQILFEHALDKELRAGLTQPQFDRVTRLEFPAPTRMDKNIKLVECSAQLVVDASAGVAESQREQLAEFILALALATRGEGVLDGFDKAKKEFRFNLDYSSQLVESRQLVSTKGITKRDVILMTAFAASHSIPRAQTPVAAAQPAPASPKTQEEWWKEGLCRGLAMHIPDQAAGCLSRLNARLQAATAEMGQAFVDLKAVSSESQQTALGDNHRAWLQDLKACNTARRGDTMEDPSVTSARCHLEETEGRTLELRAAHTMALAQRQAGPAHPPSAPKAAAPAVAPINPSEELKAQDARLNSVYQAVMAKLTPEQRDSLRLAQRQWIRDRDAKCGSSPNLDAPGRYEACSIEFTKQRVSELERM